MFVVFAQTEPFSLFVSPTSFSRHPRLFFFFLLASWMGEMCAIRTIALGRLDGWIALSFFLLAFKTGFWPTTICRRYPLTCSTTHPLSFFCTFLVPHEYSRPMPLCVREREREREKRAFVWIGIGEWLPFDSPRPWEARLRYTTSQGKLFFLVIAMRLLKRLAASYL